jgi:CBS domain-containing protein
MGELTAKDLMTTEVRPVRAETPLEEVAQVVAEHHVSGVPVVDAEDHIVGILTEADLIDEHARERHIPRMALYDLFPVSEDVLKQAYDSGKKLKARDLLRKQVIAASEETGVRELADMMVMRHINRVPIVRDGKLVGIVSPADLVRALAQNRGE